MAVIDRARAKDPFARIGGGDIVHPGPSGHALMAATILGAMEFPSFVASVGIDAKTGKITDARGSKVMRVVASESAVQFERLDTSIPFFPPDAYAILDWTKILTDLNEYNLRVSGLISGMYDVRLDGILVARYSGLELEKGVNLALAVLKAGPIADQVSTIWRRITEKNDFFKTKIFRQNLSTVDLLDRMKRLAALETQVRKSLVISPHLVEVVPTP